MAQFDSAAEDQTISLVMEAFTKVAKDLSDNPERVTVRLEGVEESREHSTKESRREITSSPARGW